MQQKRQCGGHHKVKMQFQIFTDASVNVQTKIGYGAYLVVPDDGVSLDVLRSRVKVKRFDNTSSTKLELQTLLWALDDIDALDGGAVIYTDSQNIMTLQARRARYERNYYRSNRNRLLKNYQLYMEFYAVTDRVDCIFKKVRGHSASNRKDAVDQLFSLVDRASRMALRTDQKE